MKNKESLLNKILDQYLDGVITQEQVKELHEKIERDEDFIISDFDLDQIELPEDLLNAPIREERVKYLPPIEAHNVPTRAVEPTSVSKARKFMLSAIFFFAIIVVAPVLMIFMPVQNVQHLFNEYFQPLDIQKSKATSIHEQQQKLWQEAKSLYVQQDYKGAIEKLSSLKHIPSNFKLERDLYVGIAYMAQNKLEDAIIPLQNVATNDDYKEWQDEACWYLSLAFLKMGNLEKTQIYLNKVVKYEDTTFEVEAKELGGKLFPSS